VYADGSIHVREGMILDNANPVDFTRILYHEFTHNGQDFVAIGRVLENSPVKVTAAEMERLVELRQLQGRADLDETLTQELETLNEKFEWISSQYSDAVKNQFKLSEEHLLEVLRAREDNQIVQDLLDQSQTKVTVDEMERLLELKRLQDGGTQLDVQQAHEF